MKLLTPPLKPAPTPATLPGTKWPMGARAAAESSTAPPSDEPPLCEDSGLERDRSGERRAAAAALARRPCPAPSPSPADLRDRSFTLSPSIEILHGTQSASSGSHATAPGGYNIGIDSERARQVRRYRDNAMLMGGWASRQSGPCLDM